MVTLAETDYEVTLDEGLLVAALEADKGTSGRYPNGLEAPSLVIGNAPGETVPLVVAALFPVTNSYLDLVMDA